MPDRVLRDEILESERWLSLPSDTHRLVFVGILLRADDFGNLEGGSRRMFRFMHGFAQVKTETDSTALMIALADADMVRRYELDGREWWHLPRTMTHRNKSYLVRKCPPSPWCDPNTVLGKHIRSVTNQGHAKNLPETSQERDSNVLLGVGVGVGENLRKARPVDKSKKAGGEKDWKYPKIPPYVHDAWIDREYKAGRLKLRSGETYEQVKSRLIAERSAKE